MYKNPNGDKTNIERQFLLAHRLKQNKYSDDLESGDASMMARWRWLVGDELMSFLIELWFDTRYHNQKIEKNLVGAAVLANDNSSCLGCISLRAQRYKRTLTTTKIYT
ncbi:hypothetical protein DERP_007644 [Dermatophagoides pteronyssinus]|uniref:Uncharacterized protein n=1 Tax=Dermatophagoides pteronyssinus TaxID=6956 RepID=A0ABQ8JKC2_DERPT|nr:hypothetical protein DERP_007644 [Dermatophagoides pteronyssinus]